MFCTIFSWHNLIVLAADFQAELSCHHLKVPIIESNKDSEKNEWSVEPIMFIWYSIFACLLTIFILTSKHFPLIIFITYTVFPRIVSAETILFWKLDFDHYSREETIQGRKLFFYFTFCIQFYFPPLNNGRKYYYKVHIFCGLFRIYEL